MNNSSSNSIPFDPNTMYLRHDWYYYFQETYALIEWIKINKGKGKKIGVLVAIKQGNDYQIGWSLNTRYKFDKDMAITIAIRRSHKKCLGSCFYDGIYEYPLKLDDENVVKKLYPQSITSQLNRFKDRCKRYFKEGVLLNDISFIDINI